MQFRRRAASSVVLGTAALLLAGSVGPATAAPRPAATHDAWPVPASAWITIRGHGYGHGHGMSQYGAEGAARQGVGYRKILRFYYPGTDWGSAGGRVSVLITADPVGALVVEASPQLTVRDTAGGRRLTLPRNGASRWRIAVGQGGVTGVAYRRHGWHRWRDLRGEGEFYAGGRPITLVTPEGDRAYRGRLRSQKAPGGLLTVNNVLLDNYLKGVVPLEMPASWSGAALRAQAVAARTYAAYERAHPLSPDYQICDTTSCQVYGGYDAEHPDSNRAIDATAGRILTWRQEPAFTQFSSSSGGWTAAGSVPYLPAQRDPWDDWSGNPVHSWSTRITDRRVERAWPAIGNLRRIVVDSRDGNGQWGGRVRSLTLVGSSGRVRVSGDDFRWMLGLRSTWVTFSVARRSR